MHISFSNDCTFRFADYTPAAELANDIVDILTAGGDSRSLEQDMTDDPEEEKRKRERNAIPKPKSRRM